jgi:hypothetical protein
VGRRKVPTPTEDSSSYVDCQPSCAALLRGLIDYAATGKVLSEKGSF